MDINTIIIISTNITIAIGLVAVIITLHINQSKKIDDVKNELTNVKVETTNAITNLKVEIANLKAKVANLNAKFGIVEERNTATNKRVDKMEIELKEFKSETKTESKDQRNFIIDFFKVQNKEIPMEEPQVAV